MKPRVLAVVALAFVMPALAVAQALPSLQSLRVSYATRKTTLKPTGELKTQLDAVDREIADATRLGQTAQIRRLVARGMTLLAGKAWDDAADYAASLVIRTDRVVIDPAKPWSFRLEQLYQPSIELTRSLSARAFLRERRDGANAPIVKELGTFDGVPRDLRDLPFWFDADLSDLANGTYQLNVEVRNDTRPLGTATLIITVRKGLDAALARLEAAATTADESLRADLLFPIDRIRSVNRGRLELRTFNPERDLVAAEATATAVQAKQNPFAGRTGDFKRHYRLEAAQEIMPYRLYVPKSYNGSQAFPLIVALHGLGGTEDSMFENYERRLPALAEQRGYIVVAPFGYRVDGGYGWGVGPAPGDAIFHRLQELSEQDVMHVLRQVQAEYRIDKNRIYLTGHSMGGIGTWKLAAKYPDLWAALAPFAGTGVPRNLEPARHIPEFVVHGDADPTVPVQGSRAMVAKLKELGTEVTYVEVPGGNHGNVVAPNFPAMFDFFDAHRKRPNATPSP